jgi:DNA-binding winged helix-turn-helix (wHTH) protein
MKMDADGPATRYAFEDVELDTACCCLDAPVTLEPKAFAVLQCSSSAPQVVDKAEMFAAVWDRHRQPLTRIVAQLRRALGDERSSTLHRAAGGYRLPSGVRLDGHHAAAAIPARRLRPRHEAGRDVRRWLVAGRFC